jgi:hypothetical protein
MIDTVPPPASHRTVQVVHVGRERQPVVIVDGLTGAVAALVEQAARSRFQPAATVGSFYPGLLGPAPTSYLDMMVKSVLPLIAAHFGTGPVMPARARGNFSLVTTAPGDLAVEQRVPHVDTADALQFATVHFLCDAGLGGTGFFRHRATGFETIDAARLPAYHTALDAELAATPPPAAYVAAAGNDLFEGIGMIEARADRLILYRAGLLHSGLIGALPDAAADPRRGRLTGNLFLQCRRVAA